MHATSSYSRVVQRGFVELGESAEREHRLWLVMVFFVCWCFENALEPGVWDGLWLCGSTNEMREAAQAGIERLNDGETC